MTRSLRRLLGPAIVAVAIVGCSTNHDVGSTSQEQLCNALAQPTDQGSVVPEGFLYEPLIEGAAANPTDLPLELQVIAISYQTKSDAYDQLGAYEPAIQFAATLNDLSTDGLLGPSTLSPKVLDSALAIDQAVEANGCP